MINVKNYRNDVVDTIINVKNFMYEEHRIQVYVNGRFTTTIKIKPIDLCTILSNALDNAINANAGLSAAITRFIEIDIMANRNYYLVTLKNPVEKQVEVKNNHIVNSVGNGMGNIEKTVITYGGYIKINSMPDVFTLEIVFPS